MKKIWERNSVMILSDMFGYTLALQDLQNMYSAIYLRGGQLEGIEGMAKG